jgi:hypothetical protein
MKTYILEKKNQPQYSWERYVIMAPNKIEMKKIAKAEAIDIEEFDIEVISKPGLVHTDIY